MTKFAKNCREQVTLQPGDYVLTEGMTEEQYHAVAKAFINAGCEGKPQAYICVKGSDLAGWSMEFNRMGHCTRKGTSFDRQLSIEQVLTATNSGNPQGHPHAQVMADYAEDARSNARPWELWEHRDPAMNLDLNEFEPLYQSPQWRPDTEYRRKPVKTERELAVEGLRGILDEHLLCPASPYIAGVLYDAGYRRQLTEPEWIEWHGGECPIEGNQNVFIRLRSGVERESKIPRSYVWEHYDVSGDIVAYRLSK